jgi:hypothetical protein
MKQYIMLLLIAATSIAVNAQTKSGPYQSQSFPSETIQSVVSETSGGNITVSAVNPAESRVEVFVSGNGNRKNKLSNDEIKSRIANDYTLDISVNNTKLTVTAKPKQNINWKNGLTFSFKIYVPSNISTKLQTSGGNIVLTGLSGDQDFTTSGGNLDLNALAGKVRGRTSGGNIFLKDCKDELNLETSGGSIQAENSSGHIHLSTSGGSIELGELKGNIEASTSGGNIEANDIDGELEAQTSGGNLSLQKLKGSVKASTSGGNIDVYVIKAGNYISINNSSGGVSLKLPKNTGMDVKFNAMRISTENLENFSGSNSKEEIKGTVNGGGIPVTVNAGSGHIHVAFN